MLKAIQHRGPDDSGQFVGPQVAFGATRLSIIDIGGGHQPMWSPDASVGIAYNGEIYNSRELAEGLVDGGVRFRTRCDTETVLQLYCAGGHADLPALFGSLRGMFALAIVDGARERLVLARDPFGIKPLYYRVSASGTLVAFASEIKALLVDPDCPRVLNVDALVNYLSLHYNPLPETFFTGIHCVPPGSFATVELATGRMELHRYWTYEFDDPRAMDEDAVDVDALAAEVRGALEKSVARHLISDVPVGAFLSGGVDSAIIATLAQEHRRLAGLEPLKTFTLGFAELNEFAEAREVADRIGSDHHEVTITAADFLRALPDLAWHLDEPVADPSAASVFYVSEAAREHVSVVLSGEGSDEVFGGYRIYREPVSVDRVRRLPRPVRALAVHLGRSRLRFRGRNFLRRASIALEDRYYGGSSMAPTVSGFSTFSPEELPRLLKGRTDLAFRPPGHTLAAAYPESSSLPEPRRMQLIDINNWLPGDILAKADRMSMAHSLELRVPFLDLDVARVSAHIPDTLKYRDGTTKWILRHAFRRVLPASTERREKLGFPTPLRQWITQDPDVMLAPIRQSARLAELVDMTYVEELATLHAAGRIDASRRILLLLMLAAWLDAFMDGDAAVRPSRR